MDATIGWQEVLRRRGDRDLVLVDVLPRESFEEGRIPGSISLPVAEIPARAAAMLPRKDAEIAVYCAGPG